eukprot:7421917-Alexandrium_andersonii.AAC.1
MSPTEPRQAERQVASSRRASASVGTRPHAPWPQPALGKTARLHRARRQAWEPGRHEMWAA